VLVNAEPEGDVALEAMRRREARIRQANGMPGAAAGVVSGVVDAVAGAAGAVKRVTKIEAAKAWLISRLVDGPVDAVTIEEDGKKAGHSLKNLKTAKQRIKAGSLRRGHSWFWHLPMRARGKES
jgi:hypothetical protein